MSKFLPWLTMGLMFILWSGLAAQYPPILLPSPMEVAQAGAADWGKILEATQWTAIAAISGLVIASCIAISLAVAFTRFKWLELAITPFAVLLQTLPVIVIAPLLVVWLGYGLGVSIVTATLVCFFPLLTSTHMGLSSTPREGLALFRLHRASWGQTLLKLRFPYALPMMFSGLRTAVGLSVIGAIVGEFVGSNGDPANLGYLSMRALRSADTALGFAMIFAAAILALFLFTMVRLLEKKMIGPWHSGEQS
jgi:NitT/TauT family transport system permease protein